MARVIHRKNTPEGPRYRYWSENVDSYITPELTREQMVQVLKDEAREIAERRYEELVAQIEERMQRTDERGTSSRISRLRDMSTWDIQRDPEEGA